MVHKRDVHSKRAADLVREIASLSDAYLASLSVSFVPIENTLELYVFEAFAAMSLRTHEWNTFRTH